MSEHAQTALFADPAWTERWAPGDRVRDMNLGHEGVVVAVDDAARIHVRWVHHPRWGTYEVSYGYDRRLKNLGAAYPLPACDAVCLDCATAPEGTR